MTMNMADRTSVRASAMVVAVAESETSSVMEGGLVNTDAVSPGALMALATIFMKSKDKRLADRIILPESFYILGCVRADHLYLHILARCLVMWNDIDRTEDSLHRVIPALQLPIKVEDHPDNIHFDSSFEASRNQIMFLRYDQLRSCS